MKAGSRAKGSGDMDGNRKGEAGPVPYRTGRFFTADSKWYFASREGLDHGPFISKEQAAAALALHIENCQQVESHL